MRKMMMSAVALTLSLIPAVAGAWETGDIKDHFDDVIGKGTVVEGTASSDRGGKEQAGLIVRHMKDKDGDQACSVAFNGAPPLVLYGEKKVKAQYRVDKGDKVSTVLVVGVDYQTLFFDGVSAKAMVNQLVKGEDLRIVVRPRSTARPAFTSPSTARWKPSRRSGRPVASALMRHPRRQPRSRQKDREPAGRPRLADRLGASVGTINTDLSAFSTSENAAPCFRCGTRFSRYSIPARNTKLSASRSQCFRNSETTSCAHRCLSPRFMLLSVCSYGSMMVSVLRRPYLAERIKMLFGLRLCA